MQSTRALREKAMQLLAADTATLAQAADPNHMVLIKENFAPAESTVIGDLTFADFDGSTPIEVELGAQPEGLDPATADSIIDIKGPVGGFRWETTGATNLPQTIYGFALTNEAEDTLFACELLETPITLEAVNQRIDLGQPTLRQLAESIR